MNVSCSAKPCPVILSSSCVFYTGENLIYTGILTNDTLEAALKKINNKFQDASVGYIFNNGISQINPRDPVQLGGDLVKPTTLTSNGFLFSITENIQAAKFISTGGTSSQFVKGDGSLDSGPYQPSGNYITQLSGDVIAVGPGNAVATLSNSGVIANTYGSPIQVPVLTVDGKGRITAASNVNIALPSETLIFVGDVTGTGITGTATTLTLATVNSNVYSTNNFLKFSVNQKGLVTSASPITSLDIDTVYGYTPVPSTRTLTINGVTYDLSANRSWTVSPGSSSVTSVFGRTGDVVAQIGDYSTSLVVEGVNLYFTSQRARNSVSSISPLTYDNTTGEFGIQQASSSQSGFLSSTDWNKFNEKQNIITNYKHTVVSDTETLNLPLINKNIIMFFVGNVPFDEVVSSPNVGEFTYDHITGDFTFGTVIYAETKLKILNTDI